MKKKLLVLAGLVMCAATAATGTMAYFTADAQAHNVITTGGVGIEIVEKMSTGDTLVDFPKDGVSGVMPGAQVSKIVTVENTGAADAWIRVKVQKVGTFSDGTAMWSNQLELIDLDFNTDEWTCDSEGLYWYYNKPVASGTATTALFQNVSFDKSMGNEYQNSFVEIQVAADAVQSDNNPIPTGGSVTDIPGWPNT